MTASQGSAGAARQDRREYFRAYYQKNAERIKERQRKTWHAVRNRRNARLRAYRSNPEVRERLHAYDRAYHEAHREEITARMRARYHAKKAKRDPIAAARRLNEKALQAVNQGYMGKLNAERR